MLLPAKRCDTCGSLVPASSHDLASYPLWHLIEMVAAHYNVDPALLLTGERTERITRVRQVAMYLSRTRLLATFQAIGDQFNRDQSTVQHACRIIKKERQVDDELREALDYLASKLDEHPGDK